MATATAQANVGLIGLIKEDAKRDFWSTMRRVAEIGIRGIEAPMALLQGDVSENLRRFSDLGLRVLCTEASRGDLKEQLPRVIGDAKSLGARRVSVWWGPAETRSGILEDSKLYNEAGRALADEGIRLCYHNHHHEFVSQLDGLYAFDLLVANTDPQWVYFEPDVAWAAFGGADPVALIRRLGARVAAVHMKDLYNLAERSSQTAVGTGVIDIRGCARAAIDVGVDWLVIEQERFPNLTPWEALTASYLNLKEMGVVRAEEKAVPGGA